MLHKNLPVLQKIIPAMFLQAMYQQMYFIHKPKDPLFSACSSQSWKYGVNFFVLLKLKNVLLVFFLFIKFCINWFYLKSESKLILI